MLRSSRLDAALDRDPQGPMTIRERVIIGGVASVAILTGVAVAESRLPDGPPTPPLECPAEDVVVVELVDDAYEWKAGQQVCVHVDVFIDQVPADG